jgi:hypothetical protein
MSQGHGLGGLVEALSNVIVRASAEIDSGNLMDMTAIEAGVSELCAQANTLSPSDGRTLRPRLLSLMDDFAHLSKTIEARLDGLRRELGDSSGRQNALRAYGKTPGPSR